MIGFQKDGEITVLLASATVPGLRRRGKPISVFLCGRALKRKRLRYGGPPWRENRKFGICPVHQRHAGAGRRTELLSRGVCRREKLYQPLRGAIFGKISSQGPHCGGMYEASRSHGPFSSEDVSKYFDIAVAAEGGAVIVSDLKKLEAPEFTSWKKFLTGSHYPFDTPMTIYPHAHAFNGGILAGNDITTDIPGLYAPENPWVVATAPTVWEETLSWRPRYLKAFRQRGGRLRESKGKYRRRDQ